ncbi:hypothetical protein [Nocardioides sp. Kera G14]|uniref:hypothetical protein n=1 Tax=Nocardioides sp. Kera G14 TaxID=2884264 RepID=UPI001D106EA2|nr:hypothetical protein [Nocardioides sp. Kera G14]UDY22300.1 hypothetical protein LH076_09415 [Nocardioides sp. Kera G14]
MTRPLRLSLLVVVLLLALAALGYVGWRADRSDVAPGGELTASGQRASIMSEAARLTTRAMSWRAASSDADIKAAKAVMTSRMQRAYDATLPAASTRPAQAAQKVTVTAVIAPLTATTTQPTTCTPQVCSVALVSATADRAKALLYVNQTASASAQKKSVVSPTWELVTLVRRDGHWLLDEMVAP